MAGTLSGGEQRMLSLARVLVRVHPGLYGLFNSVPWLRTHILCWIEKT